MQHVGDASEIIGLCLKGREENKGWQANQKVYVRINGVCGLERTKDLVETAMAENT